MLSLKILLNVLLKNAGSCGFCVKLFFIIIWHSCCDCTLMNRFIFVFQSTYTTNINLQNEISVNKIIDAGDDIKEYAYTLNYIPIVLFFIFIVIVVSARIRKNN